MMKAPENQQNQGLEFPNRYAVVGGVPARLIKYRFNKELIDILMRVDYGKINHEFIRRNSDKIYKPLSEVGTEWLKEIML